MHSTLSVEYVDMDDNPHTSIMQLQNGIDTDSPIVFFVRHAERPEIPPNETGNDLSLTPAGLIASRVLGKHLGTKIKSLTTSPITRCVETATNISDASKSSAPILESKLLGSPGAYVYDEELAWNYWLEHGSESVLNELMANDKKPPGLHSAAYGTDVLLNFFKQRLQGESGYHVCISHDVVLLPFISYVLDIPINKVPWPDYLQAISLHNTDQGTIMQYQSYSAVIPVHCDNRD